MMTAAAYFFLAVGVVALVAYAALIGLFTGLETAATKPDKALDTLMRMEAQNGWKYLIAVALILIPLGLGLLVGAK